MSLIGSIVIPVNSNITPVIDLRGYSLCGIRIPALFEGSTLTFLASVDGENYDPVYNSNGSPYSLSISQSRYYLVSPADFAGAPFLKLMSSVNQSAERTISLAMIDN